VEFSKTNWSSQLFPDYQTQSDALKRAIIRNLVVRATISHTPLDFLTTRLQPRVATCYPNTSYTRNWAPNQSIASWTSPKTVLKFSSRTNSAPKPPGAPLASPCETWFQTAWRASHTVRRQAPSNTLVTPLSSGGTNPAGRRHTHTTTTASVLGLYRLEARPEPPGAIPVLQCYWFLAFSSGLKWSQTNNASFI